jgi:hypothetical protein
MSENEFKKQELERLLSENKITLEQYLEARAKINSSQSAASDPRNSFSKEADNAYATKAPRRVFSKIALATILCVVILVGSVSILGFLNPVNSEKLTIESYDLSSFASEGIVTFEVKNSGTTDIQISSIKVNGVSNQSYPGLANSNSGWDGILYLEPGSKGTINVKFPCYIQAFLSVLPPMSSPPTGIEIANAYSTLNSLVCRFTFVSVTQREYNYEVSGLFSTVLNLGSQSIGLMGNSEQATITNLAFDAGTDTITATVQNLGKSEVVITQVYVTGTGVTSASLPVAPADCTVAKGSTPTAIDITVNTGALTSGNEYTVKFVTSKVNSLSYAQVMP